jgi:branched-chain amino acid transport system substrate-binding protein
MKVGILVCSSKLYPAMLFDIMAGYHSYFKYAGHKAPEYIVESIGTGADYKLLQQKAEVLLLNPDVKIILAFIDLFAAKRIEPFINAAGKILISADAGADIPGMAIPSPQHIHVSLQEAYGAVLAVHEAMNDHRMNNIYITSFYDGGYGHCYAAARVWEKKGGELKFNYVTPLNPNDINIDILAREMEANQPQALVLQYSAESGQKFFEKYKDKQLDQHIPVYASPFVCEENWISTQPYYFKDIKAYAPWHSKIDSKMNRDFCTTIFNETDKTANVFHLLGWDSAMLLASTAEMVADKIGNAAQVLKVVGEKTHESPRGVLRYMEKHRHFIAPMYGVKLTDHEGMYQSELSGHLLDATNLWLEFAEEVPSENISRWYNTYLCLS